MPPRRRVDPTAGREALATWRATSDPATEPSTDTATPTASPIPRQILATAVRFTLEELAQRHPGRSVEVRVPPFGAVQCVEGPVHKRGTPPTVVETDAATWLALATGRTDWSGALAAGAIRASGERADVGRYLPLFGAGPAD